MPSWRPEFGDVVAAGERVLIFVGTRVGHAAGAARLLGTNEDGSAELEMDPRDIAAAQIVPGCALHLGCGCSRQGMLLLCKTSAISVEGPRLLVRSPERPTKLPRRYHARAALGWPLTISHAGRQVTCASVNISAGGALMEVAPELGLPEVGETLRVAFEIPSWREVSVRARVVRHELEANKPRRLAVRFLRLSEVDEAKTQLRVLRAIGRRYLRVSATVAVELRVGDTVARGATVNLSGSGALIALHQPREQFRAGQKGSLALSLPGEILEIEEFSFTRVHTDGHGAMEAAADFSNMERDERQRLVEFVMREIRGV